MRAKRKLLRFIAQRGCPTVLIIMVLVWWLCYWAFLCSSLLDSLLTGDLRWPQWLLGDGSFEKFTQACTRCLCGVLTTDCSAASCNIGSNGLKVETSSGILDSSSSPAGGVQTAPAGPAPGLPHGDGCNGLQCLLGPFFLACSSPSTSSAFSWWLKQRLKRSREHSLDRCVAGLKDLSLSCRRPP
jgi:hypothetical protein